MDLQTAAEFVRKRVDQMPARSTVRLALPVGEGRWGAIFGVLQPDALEQTMLAFVRASGNEEKARAIAEFLAESCRGIIVRTDDGWQDVTVEGVPVKFGRPFAEALGLDLPSDAEMADVVLACWTLDDETLNFAALDAFGDKVLSWANDTTRTVAGELAGKSPAGRQSSGPDEPQPTE